MNEKTFPGDVAVAPCGPNTTTEPQTRSTHTSSSEGLAEKVMQKLPRDWDWNKIGIGVGAAAAVAGAAVAARQFMKSGSEEDDFQLRLETDENMRLISSKKVEGTPVFDREGAKVGTIDNFMVDKFTGRVAYAVMSFGGTFGFGASLFPLPWPLLDYDEENGGYTLSVTRKELENAPRFEATDEPEFDPEFRRRIIVFYKPAPAL